MHHCLCLVLQLMPVQTWSAPVLEYQAVTILNQKLAVKIMMLLWLYRFVLLETNLLVLRMIVVLSCLLNSVCLCLA